MPTTQDRDQCINDVIEDYISSHKIKITDFIESAKKAQDIRIELTSMINDAINLANQVMSKERAIKYISSLPGYAVGKLLLATGDVKIVDIGSKDYDIVAKHYYKNESTGYNWKWAGTYEIIDKENTSYDNVVMKSLTMLTPNAITHDEKAMIRYIACNAERATINNDNKLVFFRNGVWNYRTKTLTAYDDPTYDNKYGDIIVTAKLPVYHPYGKGAVLAPDASGFIAEPNIYNETDGTFWRPSECFTSPFDMDTETGRASSTIMWQTAHFMIRHMNGDPGLYSFWVDADGKGHNGKSTAWEAMERLVKKARVKGDEDLRASGDTVIDCAIEDLDKDYIVAQNIKTAYAIVGQESNGSTQYIENCKTIKMLSRAQECTFREIRQQPFTFTFQGALIQQINKAPMFSEKTDSMFTHSVNIPFTNSFEKNARTYIKSDYILREETAEWISYHLTVEMDALDKYDENALKILEPFKREMMVEGTPTMQALDDIVPGLWMNFIPAELLYSLYERWCDKNGVKNTVSFKVFREDLEQYGLNNNNQVEYTKSYARTSLKDLEQAHPAMREFAHSNKRYMSEYARQSNSADMTSYAGHLNPNQFLDENKKGRLWTRGGLKRNVKWQDMLTTEPVAEIDEDAGEE